MDMEDLRDFTVSGFVLTTPTIQSGYGHKTNVVLPIQCTTQRCSRKDPNKLLTPKFFTLEILFMGGLGEEVCKKINVQDRILVTGKITSCREAYGYLSHNILKLCANSFKKIDDQEIELINKQ